jgi:hypothetical protein
MTSRRRTTKEIDDEPSQATHRLRLYPMRRRVLHLRLPEDGRASRLLLRPAMPVRRGVHLPQVLIEQRPVGGGTIHAAAGAAQLAGVIQRSRDDMNEFVLAFAGGIVGAALMDITEMAMSRIGIRSGVDVALVGRWFLGVTRGRLAHRDIAMSPSVPGEARAGWAFHFLVGGGGVALIFPAVLPALGAPDPAQRILAGLLFGLVTSLLPWLVLLPSFGWGWFGRRGPRGANALLASPLSHLPYGLGIGAVMALGAGF